MRIRDGKKKKTIHDEFDKFEFNNVYTIFHRLNDHIYYNWFFF